MSPHDDSNQQKKQLKDGDAGSSTGTQNGSTGGSPKPGPSSPHDVLKAAIEAPLRRNASGSSRRGSSSAGEGSFLVKNLREAVQTGSGRKLQSPQGSQRNLDKRESFSRGSQRSLVKRESSAELAEERVQAVQTKRSSRNLVAPVDSGEGATPLQFGESTSTVEISYADGKPSCTARDNKHGDTVPSARGGISIPPDAKAEWKFKLERAKGLICIGLQNGKVESGLAFRKPDHRDLVWYYSSDGTLRNGARTVGKKGIAAETGDIVTMRLANRVLTFHVNETPLTDGMTKIEGVPLFFSLQMHRKEDCITLLSEEFDERTTEYLRHFSWGAAAVVPDGPHAGETMAKLEKQRTQAVACSEGTEYHGGVVPAVQGAKLVSCDETANWSVQIESMRKAVYVGLEREDWQAGGDWWSDGAVGHAWYYGSDGSLRNGNQVIAKSQVLTRQRRAIAPVSGGEEDEDEERDTLGELMEERAGMLEEDYFEPFIPHIRATNIVQVKLQERTLTFTINGEPVEGEIAGVSGRVRLAVQMEDAGDAVLILPDTERQTRATSLLAASSEDGSRAASSASLLSRYGERRRSSATPARTPPDGKSPASTMLRSNSNLGTPSQRPPSANSPERAVSEATAAFSRAPAVTNAKGPPLATRGSSEPAQPTLDPRSDSAEQSTHA